MLSISQPVHFIRASFKYRGARLAAGIADAALAAELMGVPEDEYAGFEDIYFPTLDVTKLMARTFGVSVGYLIGGNPVTHRERLAHMIADGLARFEASLPIVASTAFVTKRLTTGLVQMRRSFSSFATPADAAAYMGWNALQYLAHEEGARPISTDQFVIYALRYEFRPDLALLGEPLAPLWDDGDYPWWREQWREDHLVSDALHGPHFDWLRSGTSAETSLRLPLIEFDGGKWTLGSEPFLLPRMLLPTTTSFVGDTLYGITTHLEDQVSVLVVDPTRSGTMSVRARSDGALRIHYDEPARDIVDPTHYRAASSDECYCVGGYVAKVQTRATPEDDDWSIEQVGA